MTTTAEAPVPTPQEPPPALVILDRYVGRMDFDEFTGTIQPRLELPSTDETVRAVRATLTTLGRRTSRRRSRLRFAGT
jgi:hypothetical protein